MKTKENLNYNQYENRKFSNSWNFAVNETFGWPNIHIIKKSYEMAAFQQNDTRRTEG